MKQGDIRRIMNHVFTNFSCPNCESSLHKGEIEMTLNNSLGVVFSIECPECSTKVKVNGLMPPKKINKKRKNSDNIFRDIDKIKKFKGENLADLFT